LIITALYRACRASPLAFVLRLTGGALQHANDVAQKSMVRAWREAGVGSICPGRR